MNAKNLIIALVLSTATVTAVAVTNGDAEKDVKTVAWYTANVRAARAQNKICYDNPKQQESKNCKNVLHALRIIYVGVGN